MPKTPGSGRKPGVRNRPKPAIVLAETPMQGNALPPVPVEAAPAPVLQPGKVLHHREAISQFISEKASQLGTLWDQVAIANPVKALELYARFAEFVVPRLSLQQIKNDDAPKTDLSVVFVVRGGETGKIPPVTVEGKTVSTTAERLLGAGITAPSDPVGAMHND